MAPSPNRTARAARGVSLPLLAAALAAAVIGCGSGGDEGGESDAERGGVVDVAGTEPLGEKTAGSVAQLAQCRDWNRGSVAQKRATIEDIRGQLHQGGGVEAPPLSDDEAMEVFDNGCEPPYAQGFRLYILYARAAGYAPLGRELP